MILFLPSGLWAVVAILPTAVAIAIIELFTTTRKRNIFVLSTAALVLLSCSLIVGTAGEGIASSLTTAASLYLTAAVWLNTLALTRRGKQRRWFVGLLLPGLVALGGTILIAGGLVPVSGAARTLLLALLSFLPPIATLLYGARGPEEPVRQRFSQL